MLLSRVLVGEFTVGNSSMKAAPQRPNPPGHRPALYDSTVDRLHPHPTIFVTWRDDQAYPEYIVTFKQRTAAEVEAGADWDTS